MTIDLSGVADTDTVLIPAALTKTARLEVKTAAGTLTLTDLTPDGGDLEVSIRRGQDDQDRTVFSLSLLRGGRPVTALAGSATAVLPYALRAGEHAEDIVVAFRTEKQNYERADSTYDARIGAAVVQLRHLSDYVVASFPFDDVAAGSWYDDSMLNAYLNGLIEGVGQRRLAPEAAMNRAMLVTILWRLAGSPTAAGMSRFADVPADAWYAAAVAWASENRIVKGYSSTRFGPLDELNREQMMVILYRYEQYRGGGFSGAWAFPLGYADAADVSGWAYEAACWCTMNSIVNGVGENTLVPAGKADRAQLAAVLSRYMAR